MRDCSQEEMQKKCYQYRWAKTEDWIPAMDMIWRTFLQFEGKVYSQEGIENFYQFITDQNLYKAFLIGRYQLMVALDGDKVIGAATIRDRNQLSLLFVDASYHMQGVGRRLMKGICDYLKYESGERSVWLKAAPYAVGFYRKLGFLTIGREEAYAGIRVTPMEKIL